MRLNPADYGRIGMRNKQNFHAESLLIYVFILDQKSQLDK
jgi:hypothetical protein